MANTNSISMPGSPSPVKDETRWTDEGGSNQHYRHDDEPQWRVFNRHEDRSWHRFDATYGKDFADTMRPHDSDNEPRQSDSEP